MGMTQNLTLQTLGGISNFHNEDGSELLIWRPSIALGIKTSNKSNSLSVGFHYETKGADKDLEHWKFRLKYLSLSVGTGIKSKDNRIFINIGPYFSLLASLNLSSDNVRAIGYAENSFKKIDYGMYVDYSYFFYSINSYSLGMSVKANYGFLDIFHDNAVLITTQENKWTRNFNILLGLVFTKKNIQK